MHLCPPCKVKSIVPEDVSQGCKIIDITYDLQLISTIMT